MATTPPAPVTNSNGPNPEEDDTFERDLKQMLKDGPTLNDLSNNVQEGNTNSSAVARPAGLSTQAPPMSRSHTIPPATSNIPLSSPDRNGVPDRQKPKASLQPALSKLDTIKAWSINTYKCTKQLISERLGKGSRTVDLELEAQIEALRDTQRKYSNILRLSRTLTNHFYHVVQTQRALGEAFGDLSQKSPELQEEFGYNAETQKALCKNGEALLGALNFFTSSVNTLANKTMEDTIQTIKLYETARVEYDAYRTDLETLQLGPRDATTSSKIDEANRKFSSHKEKFDRLRGDVAIKLKFLEENKVKVTQKQLYLLHKSVEAYITGNSDELESITKQYNIQAKDATSGLADALAHQNFGSTPSSE